MTPGLVSVIVCAYNNWPDVEMTIESGLHQSYQPLEVIVVDNSSTDATARMVPMRFGRKIKYIRQENLGCAGAHNTGFGVASGEFIQFVSGDDVLAPNKIEKQVEVFRADPGLDIVYGDFRRFQTSAAVANWEDVSTRQADDIFRTIVALDEKWSGITTLGALFHRKALEKVGHWDESLYIEDLDYWLRAASAGCRFGHCPGDLMGFYRVWPGQKTQNRSAMAWGEEAVLEKALGYVVHMPYRSLVAAKLARSRFYLAVTGNQMTKREALAKLALARATSPGTIPAFAYAAGYASIILPRGTTLVRSPRLRAVRRFLARLLRYGKSG